MSLHFRLVETGRLDLLPERLIFLDKLVDLIDKGMVVIFVEIENFFDLSKVSFLFNNSVIVIIGYRLIGATGVPHSLVRDEEWLFLVLKLKNAIYKGI
jgi:hypothetical protein